MIFDLPVRIRWDADPPPDLDERSFSAENVISIFQAIREASPLSLDISVVSVDILEMLLNGVIGTDEPMAVSFYLSESIVSIRDKEGHRTGGPFKLFFHAGNCTEVEEDNYWFVPNPADYRETFHILERFYRSPGKLLVLRNPNVRKKGLPGDLAIPDFGALKGEVDICADQSGKDKKVVVHDYFLWKFLRDNFRGIVDKRAEFDGCQGGNTLAYVDWEGVVYPCESLLIPFGTVSGEAIADIWRTAGRKRIAEEIEKMPHRCEGCEELSGCFGGCRGLAYHIRKGFHYPDPQCGG